MEFIQSRVEPWMKDQRAQLSGLKEKVSDEVVVGVAPRAQETDPRRVPVPPEPLPRPQGGILLRFAGPSLLYGALQVPVQDDAGSIDINETLFFLQQAHWHWPAEQTINCQRLISPKESRESSTGIYALLSDFKAIIQFHLFHFPPKRSNSNLSQTKNSAFIKYVEL
ncbi:hypothetical protein HKD37_19G053464 [Glycine soja]